MAWWLPVTYNTTTTVDLSSLPDDASITSTLALTRSGRQQFQTVTGTTVTLDQDAGEQAALGVSVNNGAALVQTADVHAVAFSLAGLDSDDSGTLTFTDGGWATRRSR